MLNITASEAVSVSCTVPGTDPGEDITTTVTSDALGHASVNVFGLYPNRNNAVQLIITNREGDQAYKTISIQTDPLPSYLPDSTDITAAVTDNSAATRFILYYPYKTANAPFNSPGNNGYPVVLDRHGKVRWYMTNPFVLDMKPLANGHYLQYYYNYVFREVDLMGKIYNEFMPPFPCHHDFVILPNGNIVYTGTDQSVNQTQEDKIYEIEPTKGTLVRTINLYTLLDPSRPQQPFIATAPDDWLHNNSLAYDAADNSLIFTGRHQSTICKIDYNSGQIRWIISSPDYWKASLAGYLLQPAGSDFEYTWGQHSAVINPADHNSIMVFDNGNGRSYTTPLAPQQSYSRMVEFHVDPARHTVTQTFSFGKQFGSENYSPALGSVDYSGSNLFVCFPLIIKTSAGVSSDNAGTPSIRFMETDRSGKVTLDIHIRKGDGTGGNGYRTYRGHPFHFSS
jgi:arylsulfate sulfotransferase